MQWAFKIEQRQQITVLYFCYVERVRGPLPVYIWVWAPHFINLININAIKSIWVQKTKEIPLGNTMQRNVKRVLLEFRTLALNRIEMLDHLNIFLIFKQI